MKKIIFGLTLFTSISSYAGIYCRDIELDLKNKTLNVNSWGIQNQKVNVFSTNDNDGYKSFTAFNDKIVLIVTPVNKRGWSGQNNAYLTDLAMKKILSDECNLH